VPALILLVLVFLCPESPRFLIRNDKYAEAFLSLRQLRGSDIQAAKDLYYIHSQLQIETELIEGKRPEKWWAKEVYQEKVKGQSFFQRVGALFTVQRNRRACVAAFLVMAAQQLCGVSDVHVDPVSPSILNWDSDQCSFVLLIYAIPLGVINVRQWDLDAKRPLECR
jgi:hypothetical protein